MDDLGLGLWFIGQLQAETGHLELTESTWLLTFPAIGISPAKLAQMLQCDWQQSHMQPMVLVYLPTKLSDFLRVNVGKYSSTMEHLGMLFE